MYRKICTTVLIAGILPAANGCHHRSAVPVVLPAQTPVPLIDVPTTAESLPTIEQPKTSLPTVPVAKAAEKPKKVKKRSAKPATQTAGAATTPASPAVVKAPEVTPAPAAKPESGDAAVGALTVGGEQSPRALADARELIATNERRLNGLDAAKTQAELVSKVRNFQRDAQQALKSGDAEGAKTLATKGKLLLDDLSTTTSPE